MTAGMAIYDTMQYVKQTFTRCALVKASMGALLLCAGAAGKRACLQIRVMIPNHSVVLAVKFLTL